MSSESALTPAFLRRLDRHLLLHYRMLWESRIHYVAFYGGIGWAFALLLGAMYPLSLQAALPNPEVVLGLGIIPTVLALVFWGYKQYLYSVEREFGRPHAGMSQLRMGLQLLCAAIIILPSLAAPYLLHKRIAGLAPLSELVADASLLNAHNIFFPVADGQRGGASFYDLLDCVERTPVGTCEDMGFYEMDRFYLPIEHEQGLLVTGRAELLPDREAVLALGALSDGEVLSRIAAYREVFAKYGGNIPYSDAHVLECWKGKKVFFGKEAQWLDAGQIQAQSTMYDIAAAKRPMSAKNRLELFCAIACAIFAVALAANAVKSVSLRELAISAVAFGGLFVGGILVSSLVHEFRLARFDSFMMFFASACYVAVFVVAMRMKWQRSYSLVQAVSLTLANLSSPFLVFWGAVVAKQYGWIDLASNDYTLSLLLLSGMALYLAVLMPIFQQRFRLLLAMPRG